jgi:hypothetical protein
MRRGAPALRIGQVADIRPAVVLREYGDQGSIDATLDGREIVHYRGPTVYTPRSGLPLGSAVYFKTGLYRDARGETPWTIYPDEYRKDDCSPRGRQ